MKQTHCFTYIIICLFCISCTTEEKPTSTPSDTLVERKIVETTPEEIQEVQPEFTKDKEIPTEIPEVIETPIEEPIETVTDNTKNTYTWINEYQIETALVNQIAVPNGYTRIATNDGSFADWLRHLPLKPKGSKVYYYNGDEKYNQNVHKAVLDIDIGKRDLQQCADAVMRLKAEYHYSKKEMKDIHFNFTSGHKVAFSDWSKGKKPIIKGNKVSFSRPNGNVNTSYSNFKKYLISIFNYAGTASLSKELKPKNIQDIEIGDVFIQGGFPGHAVLVMDMAQNSTGEKIFLIAQSYMPAQSIHVLKNINGDLNGVWYKVPAENNFPTPEWNFTSSNLMAFNFFCAYCVIY